MCTLSKMQEASIGMLGVGTWSMQVSSQPISWILVGLNATELRLATNAKRAARRREVRMHRLVEARNEGHQEEGDNT